MRRLAILGTRGPGSAYGGFETLANQLHVSAMASGLECEILGFQLPNSNPSRTMRPSWMFSYLQTPLTTLISAMSIRKTDYDAFLIVNPVNVFTALLITRFGKPVLLHLDGRDDLRKKWGPLSRLVIRTSRIVACRSRLNLIVDSHHLVEWYRETHSRTVQLHLYGGCPIAERKPSHRWGPNDAGHLLVVARPEPENQTLEICRAFLNSSNPLTLVVVGAPVAGTSYWKEIQRTVQGSPRISLTGLISDRTKRCKLYVGSRAVIHGHTVGGTNPSLVDALSHGCPVLAHDNPFNREVAGRGALYWKTEDELVHLLNDDSLVYPQVDPDQFIKKYNWADVTKRYFRALGLDVESQRS